MLAHPPCASISHWLGSFQKILGSFQVYQIYQNYPINVKCLHRGGAQAFHIDWVKLDLLGITHWLGRISKLPNQCEKFQKYLRNFKTAQSMYGNYPINVKCLQQAFHIDWDIFTKFQKYLRNFKTAQSMYGNYPINVKCLQQAFHIDWDIFTKFQKYLRNFKTAQSMYGNYPINVKCLQQAFHIDWVVYLKNLLPISKLPNQCMKTSQSMWNACSKHFTLIGLYISKISCQFQNCLINIWKLPNLCEMLAASISHQWTTETGKYRNNWNRNFGSVYRNEI